jgi:hypothetical protein
VPDELGLDTVKNDEDPLLAGSVQFSVAGCSAAGAFAVTIGNR